MKRTIRATSIAMIALAASVVIPGPALGVGAEVTSGRFHVFASGVGNSTYDDVDGRAHMVRTADGRTIVKVNVTGLVPNTTYGSHVHAAACDTGFANGHYKFDPAGAVTPPNEIWPGFTTDASGAGDGKDTASWTAGPTAVSVVIHAPGGAKIACADLT